ncbi:MAG: HAD-IC family P-type ATPase, partial [Candidatus Obscuribacterales bacterium]|nr:HAD-IC family P-type ATPase [Candidatus Obscuribacterales bacterium]
SLEESKEVDRYIKARGDSVAYVAFDSRLVGMIAYHDSVRPEAAPALARLRQQGIREIIMTSGDAGEPVERIANEIGVERVFTQLSPEEKADLIRDYQLKGLKVAVVGDDVSDALAMAQADLAIAMNDSTDVCRYRADIIITDNDLAHLPIAVDLSRTAMRYLRQNMLVLSVPNWAGLLLSITNRIGPIRGTVLNNGSVIIAALNGLLPAMIEKPIIELQALNPEAETIA